MGMYVALKVHVMVDVGSYNEEIPGFFTVWMKLRIHGREGNVWDLWVQNKT